MEIYAKSAGEDQGMRAFVPNRGGANLTYSDVTKYTMNTPE